MYAAILIVAILSMSNAQQSGSNRLKPGLQTKLGTRLQAVFAKCQLLEMGRNSRFPAEHRFIIVILLVIVIDFRILSLRQTNTAPVEPADYDYEND